MKNQASFSSKDNSKKLKCRLLQFLFGTLMVNTWDLYDVVIVSFSQRLIRVSFHTRRSAVFRLTKFRQTPSRDCKHFYCVCLQMRSVT